MSSLPTGTVTFLFTDIEGSTRAEAALSLVAAIWWFWHIRGYFTEGRAWLQKDPAMNWFTAGTCESHEKAG